MKLYITEYRTREGVNKTTQHHTPQPTEHMIGDMIKLGIFLTDDYLKGDSCTPTYEVKECEIVEIRQYVRDTPFDTVYKCMWVSILENDRIRYIPYKDTPNICKLKDCGW